MKLIASVAILFYLVIPFFSFADGNLVIPASYRMNEYLPMLTGQKIGLVGNHTSMVGKTHLVDTLLSRGIKIEKIFSPEHGFRGNAADGALIDNETDSKTGIPVVSLYGDHKKPKPEDMKGINIMIFDIQDVGCRFYTYISTLTYVMEACAENNIPLILLDRPNPNGYFIDGPVLEPAFTSFVGLHPVPIVYGMTIGEYALMVNGEKWLKNGIHCKLVVIECRKYSHSTRYQLPVRPSPNLPGMNSIYLYPSLCLFEGTVVSIGRGTDFPFEIYGHPDLKSGNMAFTPIPISGVSDKPPLEGIECHGFRLSEEVARLKHQGEVNLDWLIKAYTELNMNSRFFIPYFDKLAGTDKLRKQVMEGMSEEAIRESWQKDLTHFKKTRNKYLLYPDNQ
ncbi:MAG: DUF1343 domain-containing protein [Bacteroidales bacterium]|nr:DUF1343 domain-containing protein [Bacteroidales bacterium]